LGRRFRPIVALTRDYQVRRLFRDVLGRVFQRGKSPGQSGETGVLEDVLGEVLPDQAADRHDPVALVALLEK